MPECSLLAGSVQAFNVMARRDAAHAEVLVPHRLPHIPWLERGPAYVFVITGEIAAGPETIGEHDTLFIDAWGRTDLPGGDHELLIRGIREKLLILPEATRVLPGHGPTTSIGEERKTNPFLQSPDMRTKPSF